MILLEAVNKILTRLGENPVDHVDRKHPTVSIILQHLDSVSRELQARGWWFNTCSVELKPDVDGLIRLPDNTVQFLPQGIKTYVLGNLVYNAETTSNIWDKGIKGELKVFVDFVDTPYNFAQYVIAEASARSYLADYGLEDTYGVYKQEAFNWNQQVWREHIQNIKPNTKNTRVARKLYRGVWR